MFLFILTINRFHVYGITKSINLKLNMMVKETIEVTQQNKNRYVKECIYITFVTPLVGSAPVAQWTSVLDF